MFFPFDSLDFAHRGNSLWMNCGILFANIDLVFS